MAAITGLTVVYGKDASAPPGYTLIKKDLNEGAEGGFIYLCSSTVQDHGPPITAIQVAASDESYNDDPSVKPDGYTLVFDDLNKGVKGKFIYMSYATGTNSLPITGVNVISGDTRNIWPSNDFVRVDQDLNEDAKGKYIYVCYKYAVLSA